MTEPDPFTSPDGRFRWDGRAWVATPRQNLRTVLVVLAILGGVVGVPLLLLAIILGPAVVELFKVFR